VSSSGIVRYLAVMAATSLILSLLPTAASAEAEPACPPSARLGTALAFFASWSRGDGFLLRLDRPEQQNAPFGLGLPRGANRSHRAATGPISLDPSALHAWLQKRIAVGDRVRLIQLAITLSDESTTGGALAYRRTAPDVRGGHPIYGLAKFEVRCTGLTALGGGVSWWSRSAPVNLCRGGRVVARVRICGRLPEDTSTGLLPRIPKSLLFARS
jgi:hypothetical protein